MKKQLLLLVLILFIGFAYGQTTRFSRLIESNNQTSEHIQQTFDGGYYLIGNEIWGTYANGYLAKISALGDTLWTRLYGDTNYLHFKCGQHREILMEHVQRKQMMEGSYIQHSYHRHLL